jgi:hypothetical protein
MVFAAELRPRTAARGERVQEAEECYEGEWHEGEGPTAGTRCAAMR